MYVYGVYICMSENNKIKLATSLLGWCLSANIYKHLCLLHDVHVHHRWITHSLACMPNTFLQVLGKGAQKGMSSSIRVLF